MRNFWLIAKHEYRKMVGRRSFLFSTLGIPLLIIVIMGFSIAMAVNGDRDQPLGYVDEAGVLAAGVLPPRAPGDELTPLRAFADESAARAALANREIQAFYVLPADYEQSQQLWLYYWDDPPGESVRDDFDDFVRANLVAGLPSDVQQRLLDGPELTVRTADGRREFSGSGFVNFILPFAAGFFFVFAVMASAGYLLQVVTDEKENRTVEIMITSISPEQLIGGKALGLMAVAVTQMLIWLATITIGLAIGARFVEALQQLTIPWAFLLVIALFFFPAYALIAGLMTAIGGAVTELQQGQQIAGFLNLFFIMPFFFLALVFANPDSPVLVALTLFPTTAFITISMRWGMSVIPMWQLVTSWLLLVMTAVLSVWASARIFRAGMLRYGQSLNLRAALAAVRARH